MARILNVSQGTYNNWEKSNTQPSIEQLIALARYFGVSVDYLIGNSDDFGIINYENFNSKNNGVLGMFAAASPQLQAAIMTILQEANK